MDYKIPQPEGASELREPAVAYCPVGRRAAEPWMANVADDEDGDQDLWDELDKLYDCPPNAPDGRNWFDWRWDNDKEFKEGILRRLDETDAAMAAGERTYTTEEVFAELEWRIKNNQWDDIIDIEVMNQYGKI